jgi:hypothetical protein
MFLAADGCRQEERNSVWVSVLEVRPSHHEHDPELSTTALPGPSRVSDTILPMYIDMIEGFDELKSDILDDW